MRRVTRSDGILLTMAGLAMGISGIMKATMLPARGFAPWDLAACGLACTVIGIALAIALRDRMTRDVKRARNARDLPGARALRRRERR